eukprot:scaffold2507_cov122-Isochrysis_galbana.AAC.13
MEAEIVGAFMAIAIAGFGALKHFDSKFEEMNKKFDQMDKQFGHKFDSVQATISDLSARFERQWICRGREVYASKRAA